MPTLYAATLGQRPEAITIAFDRLSEVYRYDELAVLHTAPNASGIAQAYADLRAVCTRDYPRLSTRFHEIAFANNAPLSDISDQDSAEAYHRAVLERLYQYKRDGWQLHLMIAGGRKAMSIYAMLAASVIFEPPRDRIWTVLSSEALLAKQGQFHIPPGMREQVKMVELPLRPARIAPGTSVAMLLEPPVSRRAMFLAKLSNAEREVAEAMWKNPYASNKRLGEITNKGERTVETHLQSAYGKMIGFLDYGETINDKRQALLDLLREGE